MAFQRVKNCQGRQPPTCRAVKEAVSCHMIFGGTAVKKSAKILTTSLLSLMLMPYSAHSEEGDEGATSEKRGEMTREARQAAWDSLSEEEKQAVYTRTWMQKEALKIKITDEQALTVYNQMKQRSQENNATENIPPFETIKDQLKMQMIEKTLVGKLMKDVEIKVL